MAEAKSSRDSRRQLGQWMTPDGLARRIVDELPLNAESRVLEPSFGDGAFLLPLVERLMALQSGSSEARFQRVMTRNLWGVEIDQAHFAATLERLTSSFGPLPVHHNLARSDFFATEFLAGSFDLVVGNPPYGGTFNPSLEDGLDRRYGRWKGKKLKKETYSFFTARSLDLVSEEGTVVFIVSDTMLTINTMAGLRLRLMDTTTPSVSTLQSFSDETSQPTLVLTATKTSDGCTSVEINNTQLQRTTIEATGNLSWRINSDLAKYFDGATLGEYIVCTSGMTIGKNELFVRDIESEGHISEHLGFEFFEEPITLERELERARLNKLSAKKIKQIRLQEENQETRRNVRFVPLETPLQIDLPSDDYSLYNKMQPGIVYRPPKWVVYWRDEGDAVITFKKNGNWYLHGVGGRRYFGREGLTWPLISNRLQMRYLPSGYILDSGAPCAFLREGIDRDELWFVLGWCLTAKATEIIKTVLNHTRNIQSKDVERLPYPCWVSQTRKRVVVQLVASIVDEARAGREFAFGDPEIAKLEQLFAMELSQE